MAASPHASYRNEWHGRARNPTTRGRWAPTPAPVTDDVAPSDRRWPRWPAWPQTDEGSTQAIAAALLSGRLAVSGAPSAWPSRNVTAAQALADRLGRAHAVLTTSGSSAILVALQALRTGPGDVVLMPATTWVSCATSVLRVGATPAFFDATPPSPCEIGTAPSIEPTVILAIHLYAQHADIDALRARYPRARVIEDASHSHFAVTGDGRPVGTLGDLSIMSLQASKLLTSGEGGAVLTDDPQLAARLESLVMDSRRRAAAVAATAVNELEPALLLHGANHALPELSAALLLDQLYRVPDQAVRRATAAADFVDRLEAADWHCPVDPGALKSGNFHGLPVRVPDDAAPAEVIRQVHAATGLALDRVYPPVPEGPLYLPGSLKQYAPLSHIAPPLPCSRWWHERHVIIPHHAFLADPSALAVLATAITGRPDTDRPERSRSVSRRPRGNRPPAIQPAPRRPPSIDVVVVTRGDRPSLASALTSVRNQQVDADVRTTLWWDGSADAALAAVRQFAGVRLVAVGERQALPNSPFERIAALRQFAAHTCTADYAAFLDDDNVWAPDHLSSLLALVGAGCPAAHSWRRLIDAADAPALLDRFPWLPPGPESVERWKELIRSGVVEATTGVVRDSVEVGMVDVGEWLFDTRLLRLLRFHRQPTQAGTWARLGEDDIILEQISRLAVPTACTGRPSLSYRLGGMSNPELAVAA